MPIRDHGQVLDGACNRADAEEVTDVREISRPWPRVRGQRLLATMMVERKLLSSSSYLLFHPSLSVVERQRAAVVHVAFTLKSTLPRLRVKGCLQVTTKQR